MTKKVFIEGMSCGHCVNHVTEALNEMAGVSNVKVSLESKSAVIDVTDDVKDEDIKATIEEVGYEVVGMEEI